MSGLKAHDLTMKLKFSVDEYLHLHEDSSQFLINNLELYGPKLTQQQNSGNFKVLLEGSKVVGVYCLTRRGNLLIQLTTCDSFIIDLIIEDCRKELQELKGFIGEWETINSLHKKYLLFNKDYKPTYKSNEILYRYKFVDLDQNIKHDDRVQLLDKNNFKAWYKLSENYIDELKIPNDLSFDIKRDQFYSRADKGFWWGLFKGEKLVSIASLNSTGKEIGQVGGVFTLEDERRKGYSKATMFHMLRDCRDMHKHKKNILFTGKTDFPAQKLYESMGYNIIGSFGLILS